MGNIWSIGKREIASMFNSPIAYFVGVVFLTAIGAIFFWGTDFFDVGQASMREFFIWVPRLFILILPALTMRLVAEEKRTGSLELLITMPIRDVEVILGKLLGAFVFVLVLLGLTLAYPIAISKLGPLDWGPVKGGYLGLVLLSLAYLGVGVMTSCWTKNQIVAFILALTMCGLLYWIDDLAGAFWEGMRDTVAFISFQAHFQNIAKGVLDTRDILFYLSVTVFTVTVATFSLDSRRWT